MAIRTFLPNKPCGVPGVNGRRVLNGIFWVLRSGALWRDLPSRRQARRFAGDAAHRALLHRPALPSLEIYVYGTWMYFSSARATEADWVSRTGGSENNSADRFTPTPI
jgi:hypothetical protein